MLPWEQAAQLILQRLNLPATNHCLETKTGLPIVSLKWLFPHRPFSPGANAASSPWGPETAPSKQQQCTLTKQ